MTTEQAAALRTVAKAIAKRDDARLAAELAIVQARKAGCTLEAIGVAAGVTHTQVLNIIRKHSS